MADYRMHVSNPDEIELQLTATMTLKEWRELREQIMPGFVTLHFRNAIANMIDQAGAQFYPKVSAE